MNCGEIGKIYIMLQILLQSSLVRCPYIMVSMKPKITWKTVLFPAIGLLAFFLYLYLFNVDISTIIATAGRIDFSIYSLAILSIIFETFFFALSWRSLLTFLNVKLSVVKSFLYVWYGIFMDIIIPAESLSSEISRVYLVTREQNGTSGKVVASLVTHRIIGMGINIASLFLGVGLLLIERQLTGIVLSITLFLAAMTTIFMILLSLLCFKEAWTLKIINAVMRIVEFVSRGRWTLEKVRESAIKAANMFHTSMKEFRRTPKTILKSLFLHVLSWLFSMTVAYLVFSSMRFPVHWSTIVVTCAIVTDVKSIPLGVPFEVGLPEITMTTLYTLLGVPLGISATATILTRILTVWLRFFIGFAAQQWLEIRAITKTEVRTENPKIAVQP